MLAAFDVILASSNVVLTIATEVPRPINTATPTSRPSHVRLAVIDYTADKYPEVKNKATGATTCAYR
jgi:hypothetical protein